MMNKVEELKKAKQWMIKNYPKTLSEIEWGNDVDDEVVLDAMVEYASEISRKEVLKWHKVIGDFLAEINKQIESKEDK